MEMCSYATVMDKLSVRRYGFSVWSKSTYAEGIMMAKGEKRKLKNN